ncbi:MAG: hypothetical protein BWY78_00670 [Alphaproteobacteria bacterium ADurb.Bin438]|nr:MAG: hypothetical protein BWY78_00670 [Alphaproteobacteria bacterium ADurb.Bin438]
MKTLIFIILLLPFKALAFNLTADEMYRNLLIMENKAPIENILDKSHIKKDTDGKSKLTKEEQAPILNESVDESQLKKEYDDLKNEKAIDAVLNWQKIVDAVQKNQATAYEISEIKKKVDKNDPDATELLAWMYTVGSGVKQNFPKAYDLYIKAETLGIKGAKENALLVLKSMNRKEVQKIPNF